MPQVPACSAAWTSRAVSAALIPAGFSTRTGFPPASVRAATPAIAGIGTTTTKQSRSSCARKSPASVKSRSIPCSAAASAAFGPPVVNSAASSTWS